MAHIFCCNANRTATRTWLFSNRPQFEYQILFESYCPNCKSHLMASCYFINTAKGSTPLVKIPRKEHTHWLARKKVDVFDQGTKDYRMIIFVGEGTLEMSHPPEHRIKLTQ